MEELLSFALLGGVIYLWVAGMQAKERALVLARRACERHDVELLDQTVALARMVPRRTVRGTMGWMREFRFEFSDDGENRRSGSITLLGPQLLNLILELEQGTLYDVH